MTHEFGAGTRTAGACERRHKLARALIVAVVVLWAAGAPVRAMQEPEPSARAGQTEAESHDEGHPLLDMAARLVNFAILAGS